MIIITQNWEIYPYYSFDNFKIIENFYNSDLNAKVDADYGSYILAGIIKSDYPDGEDKFVVLSSSNDLIEIRADFNNLVDLSVSKITYLDFRREVATHYKFNNKLTLN